MSMINVTNLTFAYEGSFENIFDNVSFQIDTDWKLGFTGRNGRGKTTFLKLLMGEYQYTGTIDSSVGFEYFPYTVEDRSQDTIKAIKHICPMIKDWEILREISLLGISEEILGRPFETLSNGEQTKVLLAAMFLKSNQFLLIDEPTNHLDAEGRKIIGEYLKQKKSFILVSHDRTLLDACVDHMLSINRTNIEIQQGNFSSWWHNKQLQDSFDIAENIKLKKKISRLSQAAKRTKKWSERAETRKYGPTDSGGMLDRGYVGHKAAKIMKRAKSQENRMRDAIKEKSGLLHNIEQNDSLRISPLSFPKRVLAESRDLSIFYGDMRVFSHVNFQINRGERIALTGKNGSGKSSLLRLICGENIEHTGSLSVAGGLLVSYVSQDTSSLKGGLSEYAVSCGIDESLFKAILRKLGFERIQFENDIAAFSEGQKKKVLISRSLCEQAHLYLWDEPLNYVDVISRMQIEELLLSCRPTLLFVEHDISFQNSIATAKIEL